MSFKACARAHFRFSPNPGVQLGSGGGDIFQKGLIRPAATRPQFAMRHFLVAVLLALVCGLQVVTAIPSFSTSSAMTFCKCICFSNSTIIPLYLPKDPLHPCLSCTKQFCLDQKLPACFGAHVGDEDLDTGTGESGDVEARCFRGFPSLVSPRTFECVR